MGYEPAARLGREGRDRYVSIGLGTVEGEMEEEHSLTSSLLLCFFLVSIAGLIPGPPGDSGLVLLE
jgi:hypothetical protein